MAFAGWLGVFLGFIAGLCCQGASHQLGHSFSQGLRRFVLGLHVPDFIIRLRGVTLFQEPPMACADRLDDRLGNVALVNLLYCSILKAVVINEAAEVDVACSETRVT